MCSHDLHYLLKKHIDGSYAGIMLELEGVLAHAKSKDDVETKLKKVTLNVFKIFEHIHQNTLDNKPNYLMHKSTMGIPQEIIKMTVECPPDNG